MFEVGIEQLFEEIKNLKEDQNIFLDISKDDSNKLKLISLQKQSMENLFNSYINNTNELANEMNLDNFLNKYYEKFKEEYEIITNNILKYGKDIYNLLENSIINDNKVYYYYIDWNINKLIIGKNFLNKKGCEIQCK